MIRLASAVCVLCLGVAAVWADDPATVNLAAKGQAKAGAHETMFKKLDTNNDGKLSKEEFLKLAEMHKANGKSEVKGGGKVLEKLFKKLDIDNDGFLSHEEFKKLAEMHKKKKAAAN